MSTIAIVGGHGKIALLTTEELAAGGHSVRSLIRDPDQADDIRAVGGEPVVLDIASATTEQLVDVVSGTDAIIFTAGAGGKQGPQATFAVDRDGALKTIAAAEHAGVARLLLVSYLHADDPESVKDNPGMQPYQQAKHAADSVLRKSDLLWTILRPGVLNDDPASKRVAIGNGIKSGTTSRANVAALLAALATSTLAARRVLNVVDGETDIPIALGQVASL
ncbi:SDR family oxidoreductase [Aeromicrobium sp. IC_218]|uniref:SDR family oxidoreductase n=1 Tax=Aeromicrobium sp. IC_218 TaxID=2545468 RepID=UPI0013F3C9CE|nr:SDR family oxidoreductase [Aeromicrobium sp. IC_218]